VAWTLGVLVVIFLLGFVMAQIHPRWVISIHYTMISASGAALVAAGVSVIRRGLSPFDALHERLTAVRLGRSARLEGDYPTEVVPLVDELNALLEDREKRVARAAARAGDLAHGLKTPLAVLAQEIEAANAAGQHELATSMRRQVERMRRQIDSHLAQARAMAAGRSPGARANVSDVAQGVVRTVERLHAGRKLAITVQIAPEQIVRVPVEDLEEMLGNLLDNACKWAKSQIAVSSSAETDRIVIFVDDDGVGLSPSMREDVLRRGVRADEAAPGFGLGLAIVGDLADVYGGSIALQASPQGGLRAVLSLPRYT